MLLKRKSVEEKIELAKVKGNPVAVKEVMDCITDVLAMIKSGADPNTEEFRLARVLLNATLINAALGATVDVSGKKPKMKFNQHLLNEEEVAGIIKLLSVFEDEVGMNDTDVESDDMLIPSTIEFMFQEPGMWREREITEVVTGEDSITTLNISIEDFKLLVKIGRYLRYNNDKKKKIVCGVAVCTTLMVAAYFLKKEYDKRNSEDVIVDSYDVEEADVIVIDQEI